MAYHSNKNDIDCRLGYIWSCAVYLNRMCQKKRCFAYLDQFFVKAGKKLIIFRFKIFYYVVFHRWLIYYSTFHPWKWYWLIYWNIKIVSISYLYKKVNKVFYRGILFHHIFVVSIKLIIKKWYTFTQPSLFVFLTAIIVFPNKNPTQNRSRWLHVSLATQMETTLRLVSIKECNRWHAQRNGSF